MRKLACVKSSQLNFQCQQNASLHTKSTAVKRNCIEVCHV